MESAFNGLLLCLILVITSLVENLNPHDEQSLLLATVLFTFKPIPFFFLLLMTSVGDSHFGQVILLLFLGSRIASFHAS